MGRALRFLVAGLALLGLAWLTARRVPVWTSDLALWSSATEADPTSARAWVNLGVQEQDRRHPDEAGRYYRHALTIAGTPDTMDTTAIAVASVNLATMSAELGKWHEARRFYREAQAILPTIHHPALERSLATLDLMEAP